MLAHGHDRPKGAQERSDLGRIVLVAVSRRRRFQEDGEERLQRCCGRKSKEEEPHAVKSKRKMNDRKGARLVCSRSSAWNGRLRNYPDLGVLLNRSKNG